MGQGHFGEVRKCKNKKTGIVRAVKILRKDKLDQKATDRFLHEIKVYKKLDHPNILKVYEFYEDEKRYYLVSELCTGGELFDEIIQKKYFTEYDAAHIIKQILLAIAYSHRLGVVHRDLKPENILLDSKKNNDIKIIDFGNSEVIDPGDKIMNTYGTAYYIAPEVLLSEYDEKCDLWSIGVILYILLAGKPPFDGKNDREIIKKVRTGNYSLDIDELQRVSYEGMDLLRQLLTYDPMRRISADEALRHPWIKLFSKGDNNEEATMLALVNLSKYNTQQKLQEAVITFMVAQLASKEDTQDLLKAFKVLDLDDDGMLSKEELIIGYQKIYGENAAEQVDKIFSKVDLDGSGYIDYSEWIVATINKKKLLSQEKLRAAFDLFDEDGGGTINVFELKKKMGSGQNIDDQIWEQIILQVDNDGNGEIDFIEFSEMMVKLLDD